MNSVFGAATSAFQLRFFSRIIEIIINQERNFFFHYLIILGHQLRRLTGPLQKGNRRTAAVGSSLARPVDGLPVTDDGFCLVVPGPPISAMAPIPGVTGTRFLFCCSAQQPASLHGQKSRHGPVPAFRGGVLNPPATDCCSLAWACNVWSVPELPSCASGTTIALHQR